MYNKSTFTYGAEIEWGDIDRRMEIPPTLGKWEYAETDIVNLHPPFQYRACDPLGKEPWMGGEVNMMPTKTWQEQVDRIMRLKEMFLEYGNTPTTSCVNHGHIHVHVPGLKEDLPSLKKLVAYIKANQQDTIDACYGFFETKDMKSCPGAKAYLKWDGGRPMPDFMADNIINLAENFDQFIRLHAAGKDGVSMGRPWRFAINVYCLKHTGTIEFRCFRSTTDRKELESQFRFVENFIDAALNQGPSVKEILSEYPYRFPPFIWNINEYLGWAQTKYPKERGTKKREYHEVA
jgi:hypothetical protein